MILLPFFILVYCAWTAKDLLLVWSQHSAYEQFSWILMIIWCLPILYFWLFDKKENKSDVFNSILLTLALLFSSIGNLGDLRALEYMGLAFCLAAFIPWTIFSIIWIPASFLWMPGSSWVAAHLIPRIIEFFFLIRLILLILLSTSMIAVLKFRSKNLI